MRIRHPGATNWSRRDFLKVGSLAFAGLDLPKLLASSGRGSEM